MEEEQITTKAKRMQVNPQTIIDEEVLIPCEWTKVQQNGIDCSVREEVRIPSKGFVNILLNEEVKIPEKYFMTLHHRSSYSRQGVFITSGVYDSGFEGAVGCSIYNLSDQEIVIPKNERILQAIFWEANANSTYNGQWQGLK